jgi:acyl-CoA thioesterase-2
VTDLLGVLELETVKPDAFLGAGPELGWGRIYGGLVVAQALRAATLTLDGGSVPYRAHSLHAYFVRAGDEQAPVLYEVERVRDGRSFCTRQVVAYQAGGAILNLIASFQVDEDGEDAQGIAAPSPPPSVEALPRHDTDLFFEHRIEAYGRDPEPRAISWMRVTDPLPDDPAVHACALAYLSDEDPLGVAILPHSMGEQWESLMTASLDHAVWFHRPVRVDQWLQFELHGHGVANGRGLAIARVFTLDGTHVATVAQEGLVRPRR